MLQLLAHVHVTRGVAVECLSSSFKDSPESTDDSGGDRPFYATDFDSGNASYYCPTYESSPFLKGRVVLCQAVSDASSEARS